MAILRVILQAGHSGRTTGATGAPGERAHNISVSDKVAEKLRIAGVEVRRVNADPTAGEIAGDWDLFLSIHYDSDSYNADGGFVDYPEPSTDGATVKSQAIAKTLEQVYFQTTGIRNVPARSNRNTRYYYMWKLISSATPCVIIECGVGNRKPKDWDILHDNQALEVTGITNGILQALKVKPMLDAQTECLRQHVELVDEAIKREAEIELLNEEIKTLKHQLILCEGKIGTPNNDLPENLRVNDGTWILNGVMLVGGKLQGNYKKE